MPTNARDEKLLTEIRENFQYATDYWREIRAEAARDMQYLSGDPWDPAERKARKDAKRPCISLDELHQYVNQLINDVRLNKRGVKVTPKGNGATDQTAELRANKIRDIEYRSKAQAAYTTAFEGAAQRSYGYARISKEWCRGEFYQDLCIRRIPNPDTVYIDPDYLEADASDISFAFVIDQFTKSKFLKRWPKAEIRDFSAELITAHPHWLKENSVQVAEYWKRESVKRTLLLLADGTPQGMKIHLDELPDGAELQDSALVIPGQGSLPLTNSREEDDFRVTQYITNGVEILETNPWDGQWIPIGACFGKEMYVDTGAGSKRILMSLIRLARDPQMLLNYYRTCEMELSGMVPKTPFIMYEGQAEGHEEEWAAVGRAPIAYLQVKPTTDATGNVLLPLPQWQRWEPPIQAYEIGAEAARRAIQSSVGMYNTSVGKHDTNAQSGKAIEALDRQSSQGSFHFIDNYNVFIEHMGRMLDDLLDKTYDTPRDTGIRKANDEHAVVRINEPYTDPKTNEQTHYRMDVGDHDVTISVGPSSDSQREEAADFMDKLAQNEAIFPRIADLVVKLRNLGPIGDEIAERLVPPDIAAQQQNGGQIPPQVQQAFGQAKQEIAQLHAYAGELEGKIRELTQREQARVVDNEYRLKIENLKIEADLAKAEISTKAQVLSERVAFIEDLWKQLHAQAHDVGMAAVEQGHEQEMAAAQQQHDRQLAASQQQAAQQQQSAQQAHEAGMQASDQQAAAEQQQASQSEE